MSKDPIPAFIFIFLSRIFIATVAQETIQEQTIELDPCDGVLDYLTGCGGTFQQIVGAAFGIIDDAPVVINLVIAIITNVMLVWAFIAWIRGVGGD